MAIQTRDQLKQWFETGDKPTQQQFWDWLDSYFHKTDGIAMADITGLVAALLLKADKSDFEGQLIAMDGPYIFTIPAGYLLEKIIPFYGDPGAMQISEGIMGDTDIADIPELAAGWNRPIVLDVFAEADKDIYIDGIPAGSKIVFIKRKIKTA